MMERCEYVTEGDGNENIRCSGNKDHIRFTYEGEKFDHANPEKGVYWNLDWLDAAKPVVTEKDPTEYIDLHAGAKANSVDMVNHPPHYQTESGLEVITVLQTFFPNDPLLWQVAKYIMRAGKKGDIREDLAKAEWYLKRKMEEL